MNKSSNGSDTNQDIKKEQYCLDCRSPINSLAKKCLECGARQDWMRFLQIGNTSISLLIAAISVLALSSENIIKLWNNFADKETADFTVRMASASPKKITLIIDNDGPGSVVFDGTVICNVYQAAREWDLHIRSHQFPNRFIKVRHPKPEEIVARTAFIYGGENTSEIFPKGTFKKIELPLSSISKQPLSFDKIKLLKEVKSPCSMYYYHENNSLGIFADYISDINALSFSLDNEDVKTVFKEWEQQYVKRQQKNRN